jgi:acetoin utilization deacetylase AcuC-like enzyme
MKVGLIYDPVYLEHDTGNHVENSQRLVATISYLERTGIRDKLHQIAPRSATVEELETIHARDYISYIRRKAEEGGGWLDPDTVICPRSYEVALYAAGGVLTGVEKVMTGELTSAFALVRPPGHHAVHNRAMGFCLFNNVAIAAKYALHRFKLSRVLIADFDVHHGNGTQDAFYTDPRVLYFSTHQYPHYPGTGAMDEVGSGEGEGTTINFPMPAGCGDEEYLRAFEEVLAPVSQRFQPQLILVSAGFDPHWSDQLAMMQVTISGFAQMTMTLKKLAEQLCGGRLVFTLEGGYNLRAVACAIKAVFDVLLGNQEIDDPLGKPPRTWRPEGFEKRIQTIKKIHGL